VISFIIWDLDPRIFSEFEFLRWYGLCWVVGIFSAYWVMNKIYKSEDQATKELDKLVTYILIGTILGARLGHVIFYDPMYYWQHPIEILPIKLNPSFQFTGLAGLASHGGILGALTALYVYNRKYTKGYLWLLDRLTIAGAALGGFIRLGNLLNSEIIGIPSNLPWAFVFIRLDQIPRHPAQLYEALCYFLICIILYGLWRSKRQSNKRGFIFGLGMILIFAQRFLMEFVKENQVAFEEHFWLNMGG